MSLGSSWINCFLANVNESRRLRRDDFRLRLAWRIYSRDTMGNSIRISSFYVLIFVSCRVSITSTNSPLYLLHPCMNIRANFLNACPTFHYCRCLPCVMPCSFVSRHIQRLNFLELSCPSIVALKLIVIKDLPKPLARDLAFGEFIWNDIPTWYMRPNLALRSADLWALYKIAEPLHPCSQINQLGISAQIFRRK